MPDSELDSEGSVILKWGDPFDLMSAKRKQELRSRLDIWDQALATIDRPGPFVGEHLSGLDVAWLAACWQAGEDGDPVKAATMLTHRSSFDGFRRHLPLARTDMTGAYLEGAYLAGADFTAANLHGVHLSDACLRRANLMHARLAQALLRRADMQEAHLEGAYLADTHLSDADLSRANLWRANLSGANLQDATLCGAYLRGASLRTAHLSGADLRGADLQEADLLEANLQEANLLDANLSEARLVRTDLSHANMDGSRVYGVSVWNATLDGAIQTNLSITSEGEPDITVDNLEVAQFLSLTLRSDMLRQSIHVVSSNIALLLGRFAPDRQSVLDVLRIELRQLGYLPLVRDYEQINIHDLRKTLLTVARMACFIIVDLSDAKGPRQELATIIHDLPLTVIQPITHANDMAATSAYVQWQGFPSVLDTYCFESPETLAAALANHIIAHIKHRSDELASRI